MLAIALLPFLPHDFALHYANSGDTRTHFNVTFLNEDDTALVDIIHNLSTLQPQITFLNSGCFLTFSKPAAVSPAAGTVSSCLYTALHSGFPVASGFLWQFCNVR